MKFKEFAEARYNIQKFSAKDGLGNTYTLHVSSADISSFSSARISLINQAKVPESLENVVSYSRDDGQRNAAIRMKNEIIKAYSEQKDILGILNKNSKYKWSKE